MNRHAAVLCLMLAAATIVFATPPAVGDSQCDCPKEDFATHGAAHVLVDKELTSLEHAASPSLGFPKTMTVCMFFDPTNKGYPPEMKLLAEGSVDNRTWFPLTIAGSAARAEAVNACLQVSPTRYVRVGWPPAFNVASPGPRVVASVQVSY